MCGRHDNTAATNSNIGDDYSRSLIDSGSRCHGNSECQPGLCCARRHGQAVCQRKLTLGQRCYVPDGGLEYSLNQLCPCDRGLVCRSSVTSQDGDSLAKLNSTK